METATFHRFASLPAELRLKVWEYNLPGPRFVRINYASVTSSNSSDSIRGCTSSALIPSNLHINRESRFHALRKYSLQFPLPHSAPKIFFNPDIDILYFPRREGWLGSWNHFVNTISMIGPGDLRQVKNLAVHESLYKGVEGGRQSENVEATCMREFWEYMRQRFSSVEDVLVFVEKKRDRRDEEDVRAWMEGVLGCVVGKDGVWIGSERERLMEGLERGLKAVQEDVKWIAPKWDVLSLTQSEGQIGNRGASLPFKKKERERKPSDCKATKQKVLQSIAVPHLTDLAKKGRKFWVGGQLPRWVEG